MSIKILTRKYNVNYLIAFILILLLHLPLIYLGTSGYVIIDDVLNLEFLYRHLLKINGLLFEINPNLIVPNIYPDGLSIGYIHSRFNFLDLLFYFFDSFDAYLVNSILIRIIGFLSMKELIKKIFPSIGDNLSFLVAITYSLIPINSIYGLTVIGIPLIFIAFNNLIKLKNLLISYLFIFLYVLYSTPLTYPFILFYLLGYLTYKFLKGKNKKQLFYLTSGISIFVLSVIITEFSLINFSSSESHRILRAEYDTPTPSFFGIIYGIIKYTLIGSYHPSLLITIPIVLMITIYFKKINRPILLIIFLIMFNRFVDLIRPFIENLLGGYLPLIKVFDIGRLTWLNPFLFFLLFVLMINTIDKTRKSKIIIITLLVLQSLLNIFRNPEFTFNIMDNNLAGNIFFNDDILVKNFNSFRSNPTDINLLSSLNYKEFFSTELFEKIRDYIKINQNEYKVISYGIDPSILIFNGFYTLDGYTSNHSKNYHLKFDKIQPSNEIKSSHLLLLKNEFCRNCSIDKGFFHEESLDLDYQVIKSLGGKFVISGINILNDENLELQNIFQNRVYKIFVYKIK